MAIRPDHTAAGFTLVELSIVLVIIGLIAGGILVGQDMIEAATVRAQISQIEKYETAANAFRNGIIEGCCLGNLLFLDIAAKMVNLILPL